MIKPSQKVFLEDDHVVIHHVDNDHRPLRSVREGNNLGLHYVDVVKDVVPFHRKQHVLLQVDVVNGPLPPNYEYTLLKRIIPRFEAAYGKEMALDDTTIPKLKKLLHHESVLVKEGSTLNAIGHRSALKLFMPRGYVLSAVIDVSKKQFYNPCELAALVTVDINNIQYYMALTNRCGYSLREFHVHNALKGEIEQCFDDAFGRLGLAFAVSDVIVGPFNNKGVPMRAMKKPTGWLDFDLKQRTWSAWSGVVDVKAFAKFVGIELDENGQPIFDKK